MDSDYSNSYSGQGQQQQHHSNSEHLSALRHDSGGKMDKGTKLADAAGDLLDAAGEYGIIDDKKGLGKYIDKAADYLHQYDSSNTGGRSDGAGYGNNNDSAGYATAGLSAGGGRSSETAYGDGGRSSATGYGDDYRSGGDRSGGVGYSDGGRSGGSGYHRDGRSGSGYGYGD